MSKPLSKPQIEHLSRRIDAAISEATRKHAATLPEVKEMTDAQKLTALRQGEFKVKKYDGRVYYLHDAIEFDGELEAQVQKKKNEAASEKYAKPLYAKKQKIMDEAILGDAASALAAMENFIASLG